MKYILNFFRCTKPQILLIVYIGIYFLCRFLVTYI